MRKRALIICNGEMPSSRTLRSLVDGADFVICADGGANKARRLGVVPDLIIGDLDSITAETKRFFRRVKFIRDENQNNSDLEKALDFVLSKRVTEILVIGATGGRTDHTLSNLSIVGKYHRKANITMKDRTCEIAVIDRRISFDAAIGEIVSLLPLGRCQGIRTKGLKYPLRNESLELGVREGTSNEVAASPVEIGLKKGKLLLFRIGKR
jgi:thiamine pyrophosphokinase